MASTRRVRAPRGVRGHVPPENFLKIGLRRCNLRHFGHSVFHLFVSQYQYNHYLLVHSIYPFTSLSEFKVKLDLHKLS